MMPRLRSIGRLSWLFALLPLWLGCQSGPTEAIPDAWIDFDYPGANLARATSLGGNVFAIIPNGFWFEFRVREGRGRTLTFRIDGAGDSSSHWSWRQPVVSIDDGQSWTRITNTSFEGTTFVFSYTALSDDDWVALTPAYSFQRSLDLVNELSTHPEVAAVTEIGRSLGDEPLHHLEIRSQPQGTLPAIWVVGRQHPVEAGGSYMMEGFLRWAVSNDPDAVALRTVAEIHAVPFMNPDGVIAATPRGNLAGLDLNRQWANATLTESPEVYWAQEVITAFRDAGGQTRIMVDFHSAPGARSNFFYYNTEATTSTALFTEVRDLMDDVQTLNGDFVPLDQNPARPVQGERVRGWGFTALGTHGLTVESSGSDVTYGPFAGQQMTAARLLALGEAVGRGIFRELF